MNQLKIELERENAWLRKMIAMCNAYHFDIKAAEYAKDLENNLAELASL